MHRSRPHPPAPPKGGETEQQATALPSDTLVIPLTLIDIKRQIRTRNGFDEESLRGLAESIKETGGRTKSALQP
jgi:hypothetical protein